MKPLAELRGAERLRGLLFDIDDTLTTEGRLTRWRTRRSSG